MFIEPRAVVAGHCERVGGEDAPYAFQQFHGPGRPAREQGGRGGLARQVGDPADLVLPIGTGEASRRENPHELDRLLHGSQPLRCVFGLRGQPGEAPVGVDALERRGGRALARLAVAAARLLEQVALSAVFGPGLEGGPQVDEVRGTFRVVDGRGPHGLARRLRRFVQDPGVHQFPALQQPPDPAERGVLEVGRLLDGHGPGLLERALRLPEHGHQGRGEVVQLPGVLGPALGGEVQCLPRDPQRLQEGVHLPGATVQRAEDGRKVPQPSGPGRMVVRGECHGLAHGLDRLLQIRLAVCALGQAVEGARHVVQVHRALRMVPGSEFHRLPLGPDRLFQRGRLAGAFVEEAQGAAQGGQGLRALGMADRGVRHGLTPDPYRLLQDRRLRRADVQPQQCVLQVEEVQGAFGVTGGHEHETLALGLDRLAQEVRPSGLLVEPGQCATEIGEARGPVDLVVRDGGQRLASGPHRLLQQFRSAGPLEQRLEVDGEFVQTGAARGIVRGRGRRGLAEDLERLLQYVHAVGRGEQEPKVVVEQPDARVTAAVVAGHRRHRLAHRSHRLLQYVHLTGALGQESQYESEVFELRDAAGVVRWRRRHGLASDHGRLFQKSEPFRCDVELEERCAEVRHHAEPVGRVRRGGGRRFPSVPDRFLH